MENKLSKEEMLSIIDDNINKIENKDFNVFFYVADSEGYPNGLLEYEYMTAYELKKLGYKVTMLYNLSDPNTEFIGVSGWLGEKFDELEHRDVNSSNVNISASDFLFIPEFSANIMAQTKSTPCKRVMILQSKKMLCDAMTFEATPRDMRVYDCIVPTEELKRYAEETFPGINVNVVRPCVRGVFRSGKDARRLIVNVMTKDRSLANQIIKPFYWKYPVYQWVTFRDLRGMAQENVANSFMDGAITVWADDNTEFGLPVLEALKCGSIVLAKVPNKPADWMLDKDGNLIDSVIWFDDVDNLPTMLAGLVRTWTLDEIPEELYESIKNAGETICSNYNNDVFRTDIERSYGDLFDKRIAEFKAIKSQVNNIEEN